MDKDAFFFKVATALSGCQLVEQELKLYISEALKLAEKCIAGRLPFRLSGKDHENNTLGQLIKVFAKLSDNPALVMELNAFTKERNTLSHRGITRCLDYDGELSFPETTEYEQRLLKIEVDAKRLRIAIHNEANKFRGELYFGQFPDAD
jgi:hypothetical protein